MNESLIKDIIVTRVANKFPALVFDLQEQKKFNSLEDVLFNVILVFPVTFPCPTVVAFEEMVLMLLQPESAYLPMDFALVKFTVLREEIW